MIFPCWPDVLEYGKGILPLLGVLASLSAYIALVCVLLKASKLKSLWLRVTSRVLGTLGVLTVIIPLPVVCFAILLNMGNPPAERRSSKSAHGQQAELGYYAGFLGRDYTEVAVKRTDCCQHYIVFWHAGPSYFKDTLVEWLDDRNLRISYHTRPDDPQHCENQVGDISIVCVSEPLR